MSVLCLSYVSKNQFIPLDTSFVLGPVVQSIVSLTSSLRGQLVRCFTTLLPNILIFFVDTMSLTFFHKKILANFRYMYLRLQF